VQKLRIQKGRRSKLWKNERQRLKWGLSEDVERRGELPHGLRPKEIAQ